MRQTYWQAYQQILESERGKISKTVEIENKQVKPYKVKMTVGDMNKPERKLEPQELKVEKTDTKKEQDNTIIKLSQDGIAPDSKAKKFVRAKDLNAKYRGQMQSPFYAVSMTYLIRLIHTFHQKCIFREIVNDTIHYIQQG